MLWIILALASFLRLFRIDVLMRFIWDEGRDMLAIRNIIVNQDITLFGPFNEIGGRIDFFGVFHYYLMLPALWLANFNPVGPAIFTALLGVGAVGLSYVWVKQWSSKNFALAVALILATSPLVVRFTQWPWNPNTTGFFGILYLLALSRWQRLATVIWAGVAGLLLGLLFQLHYFTLALGAGALLTLVWQKRLTIRKKLFQAGVFLGSFVLPNLTFVLFDITHAGFYRKILFESFAGSGSQKFFVLNPLQFMLGPAEYLWLTLSHFIGNSVLGGVLVTLFVIWLGKTLATAWQTKTATPQSLVAVSWLAFLFIVSFFPSLRDEYHSAALWIGVAVALLESTQKFWREFSTLQKRSLLVVITFCFVWQNNIFRPPTWQENMPRLKSIGETIATDSKNQTNINIASFVDSDTRATRFRYFIINSGALPDHPDTYPQSQVLYVITPHDWEQTRLNPAWELDTFRETTHSAQIWTDDEWYVFRVQK